MTQSTTLTCPDCGYTWKPRKNVTRYHRQCPRCKHTNLSQNIATGSTQGALQTTVPIVNQPIGMGSQYPKIVYNLQGILNASSPENGLIRTYELIQKLLPYKYKYNLNSPEEVFERLEVQNAELSRRALEAEERQKRILEHPELIFYEIPGSKLTAPNWYYALKNEGSGRGFLEFLNDVVGDYFAEHGLEIGYRLKQE